MPNANAAMPAPTVVPDLAPQLERCFLFEAIEDSYAIEAVSGNVPGWLTGSYYINGPARFERFGLRYKHWLDGDGMVYALHFKPGRIDFVNRFIQTTKLRHEEEAGRALYRGFGTSFEGDQLRRGVMLEPPVNVSVYPCAGTLLAFGEQALPYDMDPLTLETRSEYDFHGKLTDVTPFAAHAKFDPSTGHMVNFGISFSATAPMLNVYEFDAAGHQIRRRRHPLRFLHSNHDFGLSTRFAIFYLSPLLMDFNEFWGAGKSVMESLRWQPEHGSRLLIAPRQPGGEAAFEVLIGCGKCLHLINCFEQDETLVIDVLELEAPVYPEYETIPDLFHDLTPCQPVRYRVGLRSKQLIDRTAMAYDRGPDFPSLDKRLLGHSYEDFWMLGISHTGRPGRKFFDQLAHGSWKRGAVDDIYQAGPGEYLAGEPIFVANPDDPDDAVVIIERIDARADRAEFLLFEAGHVAAGPVARLGLRHKIHPGFHASFQLR